MPFLTRRLLSRPRNCVIGYSCIIAIFSIRLTAAKREKTVDQILYPDPETRPKPGFSVEPDRRNKAKFMSTGFTVMYDQLGLQDSEYITEKVT